MRPTGWLKDSYDPRDLRSGHMVRAPGPGRAPSLDLSPVRGPRLEQGSAGSCVSFAKKRAIYMSMLLQGVSSPPMISAHFDYWIARRQEHAGSDPALAPPPQDRGSYPRLSLQATRHMGFVPEEKLPYNDLCVNTPPPDLLYRDAFDQRGLTYYRIDESGEERVRLIDLALGRAMPVIFGLEVDQAFMDHSSNDLITSVNPLTILGRHMLTILASIPEHGAYLVDNWWGDDWGGDDGMCLISRQLISSPHVDDVLAIVASPVF